MPKTNTVTTDVEMPQTRMHAEFRPESVDLEKRTVEVVMTTGQGGKRYDWRNGAYYIEELEVSEKAIRTERLDKGLSAIDSHNQYDGIRGVYGISEAWRIEKGLLIATIRFDETARSDEIFQKVASGILRHVSLGYKVHRYFKTAGEGDNLDTLRAVDWEPLEISFVPVSFETENGVRNESKSNNSTMLVQIEERKMPDENTPVEGSENTPVRTEPNTPQPQTRKEPEVNVNEIRSNERSALQPMLDAAKKAGIKSEFATRAYTEGKTIDEFRAMLIDELAEEDSKNKIRSFAVNLNEDQRRDEKEHTRKVAESAILVRTGAKALDGVDAPEMSIYRGMGLMEMVRHYLTTNGENVLGMSKLALAGRAFQSTSDFPLILANVMNKNLLGAYREVPQTFKAFARKSSVPDFRAKNTYRMGDYPKLLPLNENGEYQGGKVSESGESYRLSTFARKIGMSRQMLINDDMDALSVIPRGVGRAGNTLESNIMWGLILGWDFFTGKAAPTVLADDVALFHNTHKNLITGATSAFGDTGLENLRLQGKKQKTLDGDFLHVRYDTLVLPDELETQAEKQFAARMEAAKTADVNPWQGKFTWLTESRLSDVSTSAWYGFDSTGETVEYAYLDGEEDMYTEINHSTDVDGMEILARKDFGGGVVDYRFMGKANGS